MAPSGPPVQINYEGLGLEPPRHVEEGRPEEREESKEKPQQLASRTTTYELTAYTAGPESTGKRPDDPGYGITASGKKVQAGVTVACPPSMELGTVIHIEGLGERVCHDRGGAIKGRRIDVYMESVSEARKFGRQTREVYIIEE